MEDNDIPLNECVTQNDCLTMILQKKDQSGNNGLEKNDNGMKEKRTIVSEILICLIDDDIKKKITSVSEKI